MNLSLKTRILNFFRLFFKIPLFEKILVRFTINKSNKSIVVKFIPNNYQYKNETSRYIKRNGIFFKLNLYDYVDWWIYYGIKDKGRSNLYQLIKKGDCIIDVGANVGETIMNFAKYSGLSGEIHGFEPDKINYKRCFENLKLNKFNNITINNLGIGNIEGSFNIKINNPANRGGNKVINNIIADDYNTINVITLDQYIIDKKIQSVNLIKIDVEGFELNVLKGADYTINKFKPILFIEIDNNNLIEYGQSAKEIILLLEGLKYKIINAESSSLVSSSDNFSNCHFDIIAISEFRKYLY